MIEIGPAVLMNKFQVLKMNRQRGYQVIREVHLSFPLLSHK